ncbi:hypothetical protein JCM8547_002646 [Rhodosporidiobolus lusitaniae]
MAIFSSSRKDKHKKNGGQDGSASGTSSTASPPIGSTQGGTFPRQSMGPTGLSGSIGRSEGSGIPVPAPQSQALYSSTSSQGGGGGGQMGGMPPPVGGYSAQPMNQGQQGLSNSGSGILQHHHQQPPHSHPHHPPSHTVLYPWSQRPISLLPSQLLPPSSTSPQSPNLALEPVLGAPSPLPFPRYGHSVNPLAAASTTTGDLYIFGGLVQNTVKNDLYVLHCSAPGGAVAALASGGAAGGPTAPLQVALLETRGEVPGPRVGHASVSVGNVLIVWGGDTKTRPEERQDDGLYLLNLSTREWTRVKTLGRAPEGRYGHAAAMVGSRFYVFGGQTDDGGFKNDLGWFDLQKLKQGQPRWSFVDYTPNQVVPPPRTGHTCVTHGDCLYIFGGTDGSYHYNDTWQYDLTTGQWTELACIGYIPVPREGHAATLVDDVMYVFGGRGVDGKDLEDLAAFKISNHRWFMFQNMGPAPSGRSGHAMATWQTKVLVLGGESYTSQRADDPSVVHVLDTTKIKYPPDSARPAQQQAASSPSSNTSPSAPPPSQLPQPQQNGGGNVQRKSSIPVSPDLRDRAASPTGSQRERGLKSSLTGQSGIPTAAAAGVGAAGIGQLMLNGSSGPSGDPNGSPPAAVAATNSPQGSIGRSGVSGIPQPSSPTGPSKIAKRIGGGGGGGAPTRPSRPDDAEAFSAGTVPPPAPVRGGGEGERERAKSPQGRTGELRSQPSVGSLNGQREVQQQQGGGSPTMASLGAFAAQQQQHSDFQPHQQQQQQAAPADAFYYGAAPPLSAASASATSPKTATTLVQSDESKQREVEEKDARIRELEKRERWVVAALRGARERGFVLDGEVEGTEEGEKEEVERMLNGSRADGEEAGGREREKERKVLESVVVLKGELAKAKTLMADQAAALDSRFQEADLARSAALQEAAYYRAKLSALESAGSSSSPSASPDLAKLERDRTTDLEKRLAEALSSRSELEAQLEKLEQEAATHAHFRSTAEEQHKAVSARANATDQAHARALADFAELQKRSHGHEKTIAEHVERLASLTSLHAASEAEKERYRGKVEEHEASLAGYLQTLEASSEALTAAQARNDDLAKSYDKATAELTNQQVRVAELEQEVEKLRVERDAASGKAEELERVLQTTREAHDKAHALASGGLAELLAAHKEKQALRDSARSRSVNGDGPEAADVDEDDLDSLPPHRATRLRAVNDEISTVKSLHQSAVEKSDALASELETVRSRELELHQQLSTLRLQLATAQEAHAKAAGEAGEVKARLSEAEKSTRTVTRAKDAAEVKAGLLRALLADHGLAAPSEDELASKFSPLNGDESPEQLARRVQELEASLESQSRSRSVLEMRAQEHESEAERLREEVERVKAASRQGEEGERREAVKVREELEGLQGRHQQLEATHLKAVQYVKGTEKMLRRMKEELTRYKDRCEELESPQRLAELDTLRHQVSELQHHADASQRETEQLQQRMQQLQNEYQQTLREQQQEAQGKVRELESEVGKLDEELGRASKELEETLAVNASLNKELQTALKNPSSPRSNSSSGGEDHSRLQAELEQAYNKAEWLRRENSSLEERCRAAESKIAILLDHMESVQSDPYDVSGSQQGSPHLGHLHQREEGDGHSDDGTGDDYDAPQRR